MIEIVDRGTAPSLLHQEEDMCTSSSSSSSEDTIFAVAKTAEAVAALSSLTTAMPPPSSVLLSSSPMDDAQLFWELNDQTNNASQSSFNVLPLLVDERKQPALTSTSLDLVVVGDDDRRIPHDVKESKNLPSSSDEDRDEATAAAVAPAVDGIKKTAATTAAAATGTAAATVTADGSAKEAQVVQTNPKKVVRKTKKKSKKKKKVRFCKRNKNEIYHVPNVIDLVEDYLLEMGMTDSISNLITIDEPTILLSSSKSTSNKAKATLTIKNEVVENLKVPPLAEIDTLLPSVEAVTASLDELTCSIHLSSLPHHGICSSASSGFGSSIIEEGEEEEENEEAKAEDKTATTTARGNNGGDKEDATTPPASRDGGKESKDTDDDNEDEEEDEDEPKDQITIDAIKVLWYTAGAYLRIKDEMKRTLIKHSKGQLALEEILVEELEEEEEDKAVGVVSEDDSTATKTNSEKKNSRKAQVYCMRGLEPRTKFGARRRKTNRKMAFQAVWDVQVDQWKLHGEDTTVDPSLVSMSYQPKTRHCRQIALQIAQRDEFFVLQEQN